MLISIIYQQLTATSFQLVRQTLQETFFYSKMYLRLLKLMVASSFSSYSSILKEMYFLGITSTNFQLASIYLSSPSHTSTQPPPNSIQHYQPLSASKPPWRTLSHLHPNFTYLYLALSTSTQFPLFPTYLTLTSNPLHAPSWKLGMCGLKVSETWLEVGGGEWKSGADVPNMEME